MSELENALENALISLGRELDVPEAPNVVAGVLARLERPRRRPARRWAPAIALAVAAALAATLAVPEARSALFRVLHIGGEEIEFVRELPPVSPEPATLDLDIALGRRVSLVEARQQAGFELRELEERPDRVYIGARGTVWFLYGTPARVRLLVAQSARIGIEPAFFFKKLVGSGTRVDEVSVGRSRAFFISGGPHVVILLDENGTPIEESTRLAQNVLIWEDGGVAFRLEGAFTKQEALETAESLR